MADLISRQAAIKEIARWIGYIDEDMILRIQTGLKKMPSAQPDFSCDGCMTPKHICGICMRNYPNITDHYCRGEWAEDEEEHTMEEFMYGQDMGSEEDGSL